VLEACAYLPTVVRVQSASLVNQLLGWDGLLVDNIYIYIYIYIEREREREREKKKKLAD
jgi:hypothetical protein